MTCPATGYPLGRALGAVLRLAVSRGVERSASNHGSQPTCPLVTPVARDVVSSETRWGGNGCAQRPRG